MTTAAPHCLVIGAGTVGASCAWHLAREGFGVTLVDRVPPGQATSFGNAGCLCPSHVVPYAHPGILRKLPGWLLDELGPLTVRWQHLPWLLPWLWAFWRAGSSPRRIRAATEAQARLMHRVADDWDLLLRETGLERYRRSRGLIVLYDAMAHFEADRWQYEAEREMGFDWDFLGPDELRIMAPAVDLKNGIALFVPGWQHVLDPGRLTAGIAEAACAAGASLLQDEVCSVRPHAHGITVRLASGSPLEVDRLVVAAGAWSNRLVRQLDQAVPLTAKRGYHSMIGEPGVELDYPVMSGSRVFVMTPMNEGLRLAGTAEFARLDAAPNYRRARVLTQHARHYLPGLRLEGVTEWMGQRPMMADSLPVISPSPRHRGVFYAFGHGHNGLTQGPTTGRLIADLVADRDPGMDLAPFSIDRFR